MIGAVQLARLRARAAATIEKTFLTSIVIAGHTIPAARFKSTQAVTNELSGLLADSDISWRIRRDAIPAGVTIRPERTIVSEGDKTYRVAKVHDPVGDPCITVEGKEA